MPARFPKVTAAINAAQVSIANSVGVSGGSGGGANYTVSTASNMSASIEVSGDLKLVGDKADIRVNTKSMKEWMESVERRLLILEPKPELLAKHEALRNAYEHYKTLEAILYDQKD